MAIDSAAKRKSIVGISLLVGLSIAPDNTKPQGWRQTVGYGYFGINAAITESAPFDPDTEDGAGNTLTITAFVNCAGYEMRAPRLEHFHSLDSALDADLHGYDRLELDRYRAQSSRFGRNPTKGYDTLRLYWVAKRAGERFSPRYVEVEYDFDVSDTRLAAVTTVRTNSASHEMRYPQWSARLSTDSARDSDLVASAGTDRDRNRAFVRLPVGKAVAWSSVRLYWHTDGRAGNRFGVRWVEVEYDITEAELVKAAET